MEPFPDLDRTLLSFWHSGWFSRRHYREGIRTLLSRRSCAFRCCCAYPAKIAKGGHRKGCYPMPKVARVFAHREGEVSRFLKNFRSLPGCVPGPRSPPLAIGGGYRLRVDLLPLSTTPGWSHENLHGYGTASGNMKLEPIRLGLMCSQSRIQFVSI